MKKINFKEIITKEDIEALPVANYNYAINVGNYHATYLRNQFTPEYLSVYLTQRARELAFIGAKHQEKDDVTKELLAANIVHPDNEKLIKILLSRNITYGLLTNYAKCISKIKKIALIVDKYELHDDIKIVTKNINALCNIFKDYIGCNDYNLIIAKLNEILVYEKDLYLNLEAKHFENEKSKKI